MICNTGVSLTPTIDGKLQHFVVHGVYDGLSIMADTETLTLWNHITGEAVYGESVSHRLPISNLLHMNVEQVLEMDPNIEIAISSYQGRLIGGGQYTPDNTDATLFPSFTDTLGTEDNRRPRINKGLGVWTDQTHRYYSLHSIREKGEALIDELDGRNILIYVDPISSTPAALYVDAADAHFEGREIRLDNGFVVRAGVLVGPDGESRTAERPLHITNRRTTEVSRGR